MSGLYQHVVLSVSNWPGVCMGLLPDGWSQTLAAGPHMSTSHFAALHSQHWNTKHTQNSTLWHLPEASKLHFGNIKLLLCGTQLVSDEEKLSGRGTDSSVSVGSESVAKVCVIDRSMICGANWCKWSHFFLLINVKKKKIFKIILWKHNSWNHLDNNGCDENGSCIHHYGTIKDGKKQTYETQFSCDTASKIFWATRSPSFYCSDFRGVSKAPNSPAPLTI